MRGATIDREAGGPLSSAHPVSCLCVSSVPQAMKDRTAPKNRTLVSLSPVTTTEPAPPSLEASTAPALQDLWGCAVRGMWTSVSTDPATPRALQSATL